ncbi:MAG: DUF2520 domain-containing protein [Microthrixaceae bacterium]
MTGRSSLAVRILGRGRMGAALSRALSAAGWSAELEAGRGPHVAGAASGVDLLVLCVPDGAVRQVARAIAPAEGTVLAHTAGALTLSVLEGHGRRASLHPLVSVPPDPEGAAALSGAFMAVAGDPLIESVAAALGARTFRVSDEHRHTYHAAAAVAANHLVALMGQAQRVGERAGVPPEALVELAEGALGSVRRRGAAEALTGPVARGDWSTVAAHLRSLPPDERPAYEAMARQALRLAWPTLRAANDQGSAPPWTS